jgi:hypothetical protein
MSEADYEPMEKPGDEWHRQADEWTKEANDFRGANMNKHDGGPFKKILLFFKKIWDIIERDGGSDGW